MNERLSGSGVTAWVLAVLVAIATPFVLLGVSIENMGRANFGMDLAIWISILGGLLVIVAGIVLTRLCRIRGGAVTRIAWYTALGTMSIALIAGIVITIGIQLNYN